MADLTCVVLAGGLGTRMRPRTERCPKALLPVAGEPFAAHQLRWLASQGVNHAVMAVAHLGEMIVDTIGDGRQFGLRVSYSFDGSFPIGTGGALRAAVVSAGLGGRVLVIYGDSYLQCRVDEVVDRHRHLATAGVMTVYRNAGQLDTSNARVDGDLVSYHKGLADPEAAGFDHIDYGLSVFDTEAILNEIPHDQAHDLSSFQMHLSARNQLGAMVVTERFFEIGSPQGLADLEAHFAARSRR